MIAFLGSTAVTAPALSAGGRESHIDTALFGALPNGRAVQRHRLINKRGMVVDLIDYGAAIARIALPDGKQGLTDVVVGPADLDGFVRSRRRFGAIVGRYAGRLRGAALIDGKRYPLAVNASGVTLHGGDPGFDRALWAAKPFENSREIGIAFTHVSPDGDQRFPGRLTVTARYALARNADVLTLDITAASDRPTVANVTNHVYFNLAGRGTIGCHRLQVDAAHRVEIDARKLPNGRLLPLAGGPFDFRQPRLLNRALAGNGIDEMLVMRRGGATRLNDPHSGRSLTLTTSEPGVQAYTGNAFDGTDRDRNGDAIVRHAAIAIEPGHFADSPWIAHFPSTRVAPGRPLRWYARWAFGSNTSGQAGDCA